MNGGEPPSKSKYILKINSEQVSWEKDEKEPIGVLKELETLC